MTNEIEALREQVAALLVENERRTHMLQRAIMIIEDKPFTRLEHERRKFADEARTLLGDSGEGNPDGPFGLGGDCCEAPSIGVCGNCLNCGDSQP